MDGDGDGIARDCPAVTTGTATPTTTGTTTQGADTLTLTGESTPIALMVSTLQLIAGRVFMTPKRVSADMSRGRLTIVRVDRFDNRSVHLVAIHSRRNGGEVSGRADSG